MADLYPTIIDVSHHQGTINWNTVKNYIHFTIIRVQDGTSVYDRQVSRNISECERLLIPYYLYGYYRGGGANEAATLLSRAGDCPSVLGFVCDLEESGYNHTGVIAYAQKLRETGVKVGLYLAHNLYNQYKDVIPYFDFLWLPRYGENDGLPSTRPNYPCDLWQFTSMGSVPGISGNVDLNACMSKGLEYFLDTDEPDLPDNLKAYSDLRGDEWFIGALSDCVDAGIITGYPNGTMGANDLCLRAQALIMVLRSMGVEFDNPPFDDVYAEPYYYAAVEYGKAHGIIEGVDGSFYPTDAATREQVCCMLYNAYANGEIVEVGSYGQTSFADTPVSWCVAHGIIGKDVDVRPTDYCTRVECAIMCLRAKENL